MMLKSRGFYSDLKIMFSFFRTLQRKLAYETWKNYRRPVHPAQFFGSVGPTNVPFERDRCQGERRGSRDGIFLIFEFVHHVIQDELGGLYHCLQF
jgi:hypothetical protein